VIVAIEGIDGAGKNTLTRAVVTALRAAGRDVGTLAFPRYAVAPLGPAIRAMLAGEPALAAVAASVRASALLFALDRANARAELDAAAAGDRVVLVDRYVASNAAYGAARLPSEERAAFREWVAATELVELALPRPDLQVLLRVPVQIARAQARSRAAADSGRVVDRYEADDALQGRVALQYDELAHADWVAPWLTVDRADVQADVRAEAEAAPGELGDAAGPGLAATVAAAVEKVLRNLT
jgi:dTMP kinase